LRGQYFDSTEQERLAEDLLDIYQTQSGSPLHPPIQADLVAESIGVNLLWEEITEEPETAVCAEIRPNGVLNAVFAGGPTRNFLTVVISALALGLAIYRLSSNPEQEILEHRKTALKLWRLREEFANLIGDIKDEVLPDEEIRRRRDDLTAQLTPVYADAPPTTPKNYARARSLGDRRGDDLL
jgi:hypothetical protein